jgi:hypothetical protein
MFGRGAFILWGLIHIIPLTISMFVGALLFLPDSPMRLNISGDGLVPFLIVWLGLGYMLARVQDSIVRSLRKPK